MTPRARCHFQNMTRSPAACATGPVTGRPPKNRRPATALTPSEPPRSVDAERNKESRDTIRIRSLGSVFHFFIFPAADKPARLKRACVCSGSLRRRTDAARAILRILFRNPYPLIPPSSCEANRAANDRERRDPGATFAFLSFTCTLCPSRPGPTPPVARPSGSARGG